MQVDTFVFSPWFSPRKVSKYVISYERRCRKPWRSHERLEWTTWENACSSETLSCLHGLTFATRWESLKFNADCGLYITVVHTSWHPCVQLDFHPRQTLSNVKTSKTIKSDSAHSQNLLEANLLFLERRYHTLWMSRGSAKTFGTQLRTSPLWMLRTSLAKSETE